MISFNPFMSDGKLIVDEEKFATSSLAWRFAHALLIICGGAHPEKSDIRFGILDYLTFGIPLGIEYISRLAFNKATELYEKQPLLAVLLGAIPAVILFSVILAKLITAALLTAASAVFILPVHFGIFLLGKCIEKSIQNTQDKHQYELNQKMNELKQKRAATRQSTHTVVIPQIRHSTSATSSSSGPKIEFLDDDIESTDTTVSFAQNNIVAQQHNTKEETELASNNSYVSPSFQ